MEEISNKTKIILIILSLIPTIVIIFLSGLIIVNAETLQSSATLNWSSNNNSQDQYIYTGSGSWANQGRGYLEFNLLLYVYSQNTSRMLPVIRTISARSDGKWYICNYGSSTISYDSDRDDLKGQMYSVVCDMTMGSNGLERIRVIVDPAPSNSYFLNSSAEMTFSTNLDIDIAQRLSNGINAITTQMATVQNNINNNITNNANAIISNLETILNNDTNRIIDTINNGKKQAHQDHQEMMESDIDDTSKQNVDETQYNDYKTKETNLMNSAKKADLTKLNIGIDAGTSSTIWDLITRIIQSNTKIFALFISILSIGIIKIALAR